MKTISAKRLEAAGACAGQVQLFRETFGDKLVRINAENWTKAEEVGLNRFWLERFLKKAAQAEYIRAYATAQEEFDRVCGAARAEFYRAWDMAQGKADYDRVCGAALAEYERVRAAALFAVLTK